MSLYLSPRASSKRQRLMIITADESIIDEIEKNNSTRLLQQIIFPAANKNEQATDEQILDHDIQRKTQPACQTIQSKDGPLICVICGASAKGYNFGAIACEGCKAFFRRNARKQPSAFHCTGSGGCKITSETRRYCSACRLAKCFASGMQCDRILTAEQKAEKRRRMEENRLLSSNVSSDTNDEELFLSSFPIIDDSVLSMDIDIFLADLANLLPPRSQPVLLNTEDLQRLEAISHSYEKRIEFAARDGLPWNPSVHASTFLQVLNSHSTQVIRLLSFFKQIPEFNQLNVDDRVALIKYNLSVILGISSVLFYKPESRELVESSTDVPANIQFYSVLHGYNMCKQARKVFFSFLHIAEYDRKIIELILVILILTKGFSVINDQDEQILNDKTSVSAAHNYFSELLWKYLETKHSYLKAVSLFSELTAHVLSWQVLHEEMRRNILGALSPEDSNELLPIMKSILRIS